MSMLSSPQRSSTPSAQKIKQSQKIEIDLPESAPDNEQPLYTSTEIYLSIRPSSFRHCTGSVCVTLYLKRTSETEHLVPEESAYWEKNEHDQPASTEEDLPDRFKLFYQTAIEKVENGLDLERIKPREAYGLCHRKHKSGLVSIETRFR